MSEVSINPIIQSKARLISHARTTTRDNTEVYIVYTQLIRIQNKCNELTNYLHNFFLKIKGRSAIQKMSRLLWDPTVHYHVHNSPSLVSVSTHNKPFKSVTLKRIFNIFLPRSLDPPDFSTKFCMQF
jgi:hypothetical protein